MEASWTTDLWQKLNRYARQIGYEVLEKVLYLYFAAQRPDTPAWAKAVIYGALGYFVPSTDDLLDMIPGGYSDDLGVLTGALATVAFCITPEDKAQARQELTDWFCC